MSQSLGDFATSTVVYGKFTTYRPSTGAPHTLAGTPALSVYKDNSTTQSTTGVTLTADFDSVTGFNHFAIDTSADGTFYSAGSFFDIVVTTGTVDSVSAVGTVVGSFTLEKGAAFARIGATGSGLTSLASQASVNTIDDFLDTEIAAIKAKTDSLTFTVANQLDVNALAISGDSAAADNLEAALDGTGGVTITAAITGNITGNLSGSVGSVTAGVSVAVGGIATTSFAAGAIDAAAIAANAIGASELAQDAAQEIADEFLNRDLAGGASGGTRGVRNALRSLRNRAAIAAGTLTVYQEDDATAAWTAAVTTTAGDPISQIDPAGP